MNSLPGTDQTEAFLWAIVLQVTVVSVLAVLVAKVFRRNAALRHSVLLSAMLCILGSPLLLALGHLSGVSISLPAGRTGKASARNPKN